MTLIDRVSQYVALDKKIMLAVLVRLDEIERKLDELLRQDGPTDRKAGGPRDEGLMP